jgi:hypothetical protein
MYASVDVWPTWSNPVSFIPFLIEYYPFESLNLLQVFSQADVADCPGCRHPIDMNFTRENDRFKCSWCQRAFRRSPRSAFAQLGLDTFLIRRSEKPPPYHFILVLALDACCRPSDMEQLRSYATTAISALPPTQPFHLAVLHPLYITYAFASRGTIVQFDTPYGAGLSTLMCLTGDGCRNFSNSLSILENFLSAIEGHPSPNRSVDNLIEQLSGDDNLFARIVLFSIRGPRRRKVRNVFVDWILPDTEVSVPGPGIDGYFLSLSSGSGEIGVQIRRLMEIITSELRIFNVEITADISGYKLTRKDFRYSTAIRHFHQTFRLTPIKFGTMAPALLGVEVKFVHFTADGACEKTIWIAKSFKNSNDFIPACSTINH